MDIAALNMAVKFDQVEGATAALKEQTKAASASERAAQRWGLATKEAGRTSDDFSKRVQRTIRDLEFERQQLTRSAAAKERYAVLRRAGVSESSAEGRAILASVSALQAQRSSIQKNTEETKKGAESTRSFISSWRSMLAVAAGIAGAGAISKAADAFTSLTNAIKVTGAEGAALEYTQQRLFKSANQSGVEIDALGQLYSRAAMAGKELGVSQEGLLEFVDGVTAALRVQGGSTEAARGALLQLSQALGAGTVRAEEFNSILEGALPIAQAAARGMDGMGGSVAKLRTAVLEGAVTSKAFFDATMKGFAETKRLAEGSTLTMGQSLTALSNRFTNFIGKLDQTSGVSRALGAAFEYVGRKLDETTKEIEAGQNAPANALDRLVRGIADAIDWFKKFDQQMLANGAALRAWMSENITGFVDNFEVAGVRAVAGFLGAFAGLPDKMRAVFRDSMNAVIETVEAGINAVNRNASSWFSAKDKAPVSIPRVGGGEAQQFGPVMPPGEAAAQQKLAEQQAIRDERARQQFIARQAGMQDDEARARIGGMPVSGPLGLGGIVTPPKKSGSDPYAKAIEGAKEYVLTKQAETEAVGQTVLAAAQLKHQQDLLNKATGEGKTLSEAQKAALQALAGQMAEVDNALAKAKFIDDYKTKSEEFLAQQEMERQALFMSTQAADALRMSTEMLNAAKRQGIELSPAEVEAIRATADAMAASKAKTDELKEITGLGREVFKGFFSDMREGLMNGQTIWQSFGDAAVNALNRIAEKLIEMAATQLFEAAFPSGAGGGGGGGLGGLIGGLFGGGSSGTATGIFDGLMGAGFFPTFAKGAAFRAGNVIPFARGGIFNSPTMFPMSGGRRGIMAEDGEEAIMPLHRGSDGGLGVRMAGGRGAAPQPVIVHVYANEGFVRAEAEGAAVRVVNSATPGIVKQSVKKSGEQVPGVMARHEAQRGGEWR
ncbi:MAG: phage tape measure protein [Rhodospirillaceae bacterium]|nr:MAG: phage tape measure protein [Rhodospirillaceae bacterium]